MNKAPAFISYVVLVHGGSYQKFLEKLNKELPSVKIIFCKKVAVHYYILQLEDHTALPITQKQLASLPLMAFREEFSSYVIFKGMKGLKTTLSRMCEEKDEDDASVELIEKMLTPFEKGLVLDISNISTLEYQERMENNMGIATTTLKDKKDIESLNTLNKLFCLDKVKIDDKDVDLKEIVKTKFSKKWTIGVL